MNYFAKLGPRFYGHFLWALMSMCAIIVYSFGHKKDYLLVSMYSLFLICLGVFISRFLYFKFTKRPVLSVNEVYIFDHYNGIKYLWTDIEIIEATDDLLFIKLYNPASYLNKFSFPILKLQAFVLYKLFKNQNCFIISMDLLDIKKGSNKEFIEALNNFSIVPESDVIP